MRFFWHFLVGIGVVGGIVLLFFAFSLRVANNVSFTDDDITAPSVTFVDPRRGADAAAVTIVNFGEYQSTAPLVQRTYEEGLALDLAVTPTIFVNGERYAGGLDSTTLKSIIRPLITPPCCFAR